MNSNPDFITQEAVLVAITKAKGLEKRGKLLKALNELERVSQEVCNHNLPERHKLSKLLVTLCNRLAKNNTQAPYLRRAEQVLGLWRSHASDDLGEQDDLQRLLLMTYNNWSAYHRSQKTYHMAINYLLRALKLTNKNCGLDTLQLMAQTQLNASALYMELRRYQSSIEFAEKCLVTLQREMAGRLSGRAMTDLVGKEHDKAFQMIGTYVLAFYNLGAAEEALGNRQSGIEAYEQAVNIGREFIGEENQAVQLAQEALAELNSLPANSSSARPVSAIQYQQFLTAKTKENERQASLLHKSDEVPNISRHTTLIPQLNDIPSKDSTKQTEKSEEFRYYSQKQLERRQSMIESSGNKFVSADQYFYKKLSKRFNIENDVKHLKPLTRPEDIKGVWELEKADRKTLNDLRMKRHQMKIHTELHGAELVEKRIEILKLEHEAMIKRESVKLLSKDKAIKRNTRTSLPSVRSLHSLPPTARVIDPAENRRNFQIAKEEIEDLMDGIKDHLKDMDTQRHARMPSWMGNTHKSESALSASAKRLPSARTIGS